MAAAIILQSSPASARARLSVSEVPNRSAAAHNM
jgi:hypothetical protein